MIRPAIDILASIVYNVITVEGETPEGLCILTIEYSLKRGLISEVNKTAMEFPHNNILIKSYGRNNRGGKNAVICNNKNRCKIKRMHGGIIDLSMCRRL